MKCKTLHKNLIFFLEEELPEKEMALISAHLLECNSCASFAKDMRQTLGIIETEKSPTVNPFFYTRLKAKLENSESEQKQIFWKPALVRVLQPAIFSILLIIGIYSGIKIGQPAPAQSVSISAADLDIISFLNEMDSETIEGFLME